MSQNMQEICENMMMSVLSEDLIILALRTHINFGSVSVGNFTY